jgi:carbonic anhydrase
MKKLIEGLKKFQRGVFRKRRALFSSLAHGQQPRALFITCSDSRIDPCLITQTDPGELFILRNAGNLVPSYGINIGSTIATIEYAELHGWVYSIETGDVWEYDFDKDRFRSLHPAGARSGRAQR